MAERMNGRLFLVEKTGNLRRAALVVEGRLEAIEIDRLSDTGPKWGRFTGRRLLSA